MGARVTARSGAVTWTGLAVVAAAAAVLSFATVRDLAQASGYPPGLAWLLPVVIDATAVVGSRIWLGGGAHSGALRYARTLALAAAAVTIGANVLQHGLAAHHLSPRWWLVAVLAAIPPAALVAVAHQVALLARPTPPAPADDPADDVTADVTTLAGPDRAPGHEWDQPVDETSAAVVAHASDTFPQLKRDVLEEVSTLPAQLAAADEDQDLRARAHRIVAASPAPVGRRRLARQLDITEHHARQLLASGVINVHH